MPPGEERILPYGATRKNPRWTEKHGTKKYKLLRMAFTTFCRAFMAVQPRIISTGRRIVFRLLTWNPWQHAFFQLLDQLRTPLAC